MSTLQRDVERMLRWYPKRWRLQHGDALVSLHMDSAKADDENASLSREEQAAMRAAGIFERTRHVLPIVASALGTLAVSTGYGLALTGNNVLGNPLWLMVGPVMLSLAFFSLRASQDGHWSPQTVVPVLASVGAALALAETLNVAALRDEMGVAHSVESMWAMGVLAAAFTGIAVATATAPSFRRSGMSWDWAVTLGFFAGALGTVPLAFGLLSGLVPVAAGAGLLWISIRAARRGSNAPLFGSTEFNLGRP